MRMEARHYCNASEILLVFVVSSEMCLFSVYQVMAVGIRKVTLPIYLSLKYFLQSLWVPPPPFHPVYTNQ